jgi:hypothetical protein
MKDIRVSVDRATGLIWLTAESMGRVVLTRVINPEQARALAIAIMREADHVEREGGQGATVSLNAVVREVLGDEMPESE